MDSDLIKHIKTQLLIFQKSRTSISQTITKIHQEINLKFQSLLNEIYHHEFSLISLLSKLTSNSLSSSDQASLSFYSSSIFDFEVPSASNLSKYISQLTCDLKIKSYPNLLQANMTLPDLLSKLSQQSLFPLGHTGRVCRVLLNSDCTQIISAGKDCNINIWCCKSSQITHQLKGHQDWVNWIKLSNDEKFLVSASGDRSIHLWSMESYELLHKFTGHNDWVNCVDSTRNFAYLVSGSKDTTVRVWSTVTKKQEFCINAHSSWVNSVQVTTDDKYIISASGDFLIKIWNFFSKKLEFTLNQHTSYVQCLALAPNGVWLASGSSDMTVKICSLSSLQNTDKFTIELKGFVTCIAWSSDSKFLFICTSDGSASWWDVARGGILNEWFLPGFVRTCCVLRIDKVLVGMESGQVGWFDSSNGQTNWLSAHFDEIVFAWVDPMQKVLVSLSKDAKMHKWDLKKSKHQGLICEDVQRVTKIAAAKDLKFLYVKDSFGVVRVFDWRNALVWKCSVMELRIEDLHGYEGIDEVF